MSNLLGIVLLILFISCFVGAIAGLIVGNQTLATAFALSIFALVFFALLLNKFVNSIKAKKIENKGKKQVGKLVGAIYCSRTEVNIGNRHNITFYYYPIFEVEDEYGRKTNYTSIKKVKGEDLQKLVGKEEVHFITLKSYCKIEDDLSLLSSCGTAPYLGKYMLLDENGIWQTANEIKEKKENKNHSPSLTLYKVIIVVLSLITIIIFGGAIFLSIYGAKTKQYGLIVGGAIAILMLFFFEIKFIKKSIIILLVNKKGILKTAKEFTTEIVYFHSTDSTTTENYLVKFIFSDENGNLQHTEEYVTDDVYYKICSRDTLPIKVYKNYASINYEII